MKRRKEFLINRLRNSGWPRPRSLETPYVVSCNILTPALSLAVSRAFQNAARSACNSRRLGVFWGHRDYISNIPVPVFRRPCLIRRRLQLAQSTRRPGGGGRGPDYGAHQPAAGGTQRAALHGILFQGCAAAILLSADWARRRGDDAQLAVGNSPG